MKSRGPVFTPFGQVPSQQDWVGKRDIKERQFEPGDLEFLHKGFEPYTDPDDGQYWLADSAGNNICFADTSTGNVTITLPSADASTGLCYKVKRTTGGVNTLKVTTLSGNIDDTATITIATQYVCLQIVSDGSNWWIT